MVPNALVEGALDPTRASLTLAHVIRMREAWRSFREVCGALGLLSMWVCLFLR